METTFEERKKKFLAWHEKNPKVWECFEKLSLEAIANGKRKLSHWLIINVVRWEVNIKTTGVYVPATKGEVKISNNHIAFYARMWNEKYPEYKSLFTLKKMIGEPEEAITN